MQERLWKFYSVTLAFKCWGSTAAVLVSEYLFTLVNAKGDQIVLKICQEEYMFHQGFLVIIYMICHGTVC